MTEIAGSIESITRAIDDGAAGITGVAGSTKSLVENMGDITGRMDTNRAVAAACSVISRSAVHSPETLLPPDAKKCRYAKSVVDMPKVRSNMSNIVFFNKEPGGEYGRYHRPYGYEP